MIKRKLQKNWKENKGTYITAGILVGAGFLIGMKFQKKATMRALKGVTTLTKELNPMFPDSMPLAEIKEVLNKIDGAQYRDALITSVNGVDHLLVR
jgi:hypothetical protein